MSDLYKDKVPLAVQALLKQEPIPIQDPNKYWEQPSINENRPFQLDKNNPVIWAGPKLQELDFKELRACINTFIGDPKLPLEDNDLFKLLDGLLEDVQKLRHDKPESSTKINNNYLFQSLISKYQLIYKVPIEELHILEKLNSLVSSKKITEEDSKKICDLAQQAAELKKTLTKIIAIVERKFASTSSDASEHNAFLKVYKELKELSENPVIDKDKVTDCLKRTLNEPLLAKHRNFFYKLISYFININTTSMNQLKDIEQDLSSAKPRP